MLLVAMNHPDLPSQRDIARWLYRTPSTISELLFQMEQKGLVQQTRYSDDRRVVRVYVTETGVALYWQVSAVAWNMVSDGLGDLTQPELRALVEMLDKVRDRVGSILGRLEQSGGNAHMETIPLDDQSQLAELLHRIATSDVYRDCPDQTDSSNHVTLWDGSNYKRAA